MKRNTFFFLSLLAILFSMRASNATPLNQTDLIIYSYDRPMQLYAFLESIEQHVIGLANVFVIYRTSNQDFQNAYNLVQETFTDAHFFQQSPPFTDLKRLTSACFMQSSNPYILFGVDDIIIKDSINLNECIQALKKHNAHGFYFRLGKNLEYCYAMNSPQALPNLEQVENEILQWKFVDGQYDWRYPNNLDFTLYCKSDLESLICSLEYATPNALESKLMAHVDYNKKGLCLEYSKIINFPLNIVQTELPNKCDNAYSTLQLLELFNQGLKIDIKPIHALANKSAHMSSNNIITFIPRTILDEKLMVIVTPSYNNRDWWEWNLKSLIMQDYHNYYIIITDDCSTDGTGDAIEQYIATNQLDQKVHLIKNEERRGALHNLYTMIHSCPNEAIIVTVDGDDALPDSDVLKRLNKIYTENDIWLTYGQFIEYPSGTKGWCTPMPEHIVQNNAFREHPDLPSHLRTFYAWLFKSITLEDLLYNGEFYKMTWDYAMMLPMIEMAGERHLCIQNEIMYAYNTANSISDHKISRQLQAHLAQIVRAKKRYQKLSASQEKFAQNLEKEKADLIIFAEDCNPDTLDQSLASITQKIIGVGDIFILYLFSLTTKEKYDQLKNSYPAVIFLEVNENRSNFRDLFWHTLRILRNNYLLFSLPNILVEEPIDLLMCIQALEETHAYSFSLKLSQEKPFKALPLRMALLEIKDDICAWNYATANDVWACANSVDMMLYKRNNSIAYMYKNSLMNSWVDFAFLWSHEGNLDKIGLCFKYPKVTALEPYV